MAVVTVVLAGLVSLPGCPVPPEDDDDLIFHNTTDPTNGGATFVGSPACSACHADFAERSALHGHGQALHRAQGAAPTFPADAERAGVPSPPDGLTWTDVSYVIGGYLQGAYFVDADGYVVTTGGAGVDTEWQLDFPPNGTSAGFAPYLPGHADPLPLEYECFRCHVVGAREQTADNPGSQDGRPGIEGTWVQAGVQCEACHGPGASHVPNPQARNIYVNAGVCRDCHLYGDDADVIAAADGYVNPFTQWAELRASGGHADFDCTICHDPHASTAYDRARGIRNECAACHSDMNLAFHDGITFTRGDYVEPLTCESCHMPYAGRVVSEAGPDVVGDDGRMGDVRSHIFRIDSENGFYPQMFTADGRQVRKDSAGRAAVTPDFVCTRCHSGVGNAFPITPDGAARIARDMHEHAAAADP